MENFVFRTATQISPSLERKINPVFDDELPEAVERVPFVYRAKYERGYNLLRNGDLANSALQASTLLESYIKEHTLSIISVFAAEKNTLAASDLEGILISVSGVPSLGSYIAAIKRASSIVHVSRAGFRKSREFVPDKRFCEWLDSLRERRNKYAHESDEVDDDDSVTRKEVSDFIDDVLACHAALIDRFRPAKLAIGDKIGGKLSLHVLDLMAETFEQFSARDIGRNFSGGKIVYQSVFEMFSLSRQSKDLLIPRLILCRTCVNVVDLRLIEGKKQYICPRCQGTSGVPNSVLIGVLELRKYCKRLEFEMNENDEDRLEEREERESGRSWTKVVLEGLCTVLGPFGAPLRSVLTKLEIEDANALNQRIDDIVTSVKGNTELIEEFKEDVEKRKLALESRFLMTCIDSVVMARQRYPGTAVQVYKFLRAKRWPFVSCTTVPEVDLEDALTDLYEPNMELFYADLKSAGISTERLARSNTPVVAIKTFVSSLRSLNTSKLSDLFAYLAGRNSGCGLLFRILEEIGDYNELLEKMGPES